MALGGARDGGVGRRRGETSAASGPFAIAQSDTAQRHVRKSASAHCLMNE